MEKSKAINRNLVVLLVAFIFINLAIVMSFLIFSSLILNIDELGRYASGNSLISAFAETVHTTRKRVENS